MTATTPRRRERLVTSLLVGFISSVVALFIVVGTTFFHHDHITSVAASKQTHYGWPVTWLSQDQSAFAAQRPNLPADLTFASPWQNVTDVNWLAFWLDLAIVSSAPVAAYGIGTTVIRQRRRSTPAPRPAAA